jgi:ABC-type nickel/cobalt efflux system permease component RcnA
VGSPPSTPLALLFFGLLLGLRHALEPDHLAAVSTLVATGNRPASSTVRLGASWGLGHALAITGFGGALLVLRTELPVRAQSLLELLVAVMLVVLGARGLHRAYRMRAGDGPPHEHGAGQSHRHGGDTGHVHVGPFVVGFRPLVIGLIHGLAGTGAMVALVMATLPTAWSALLMLGSFGLGSLLGMAAVTFLAGASLTRFRSRRATGLVVSLTGLGSMSFGIYWGVQQLAHLG